MRPAPWLQFLKNEAQKTSPEGICCKPRTALVPQMIQLQQPLNERKEEVESKLGAVQLSRR